QAEDGIRHWSVTGVQTCALPIYTAKMLPGLAFPNVREQSLREIWFDSEGFNRYRGTGWMKEPCASCEHREEDLGGCRCQAYLIRSEERRVGKECRSRGRPEQSTR